MSNTMLTQELALSLISSSQKFPIDFDDAWRWINYSKKDKALNMLKANFVEASDFALLQKGEWSQEGRSSDIYGMTVDCFKSFCMMSGTEKGKAVRKYFIECERQLKQPKELTRLEILEMAIASEKENIALKAQIEEQAPLVSFAEQIQHSDTCISFNEYAKCIGWGRNKLMIYLREIGVLMKNSTLPYQKWCDSGYFEVSQEIITNGKLIPFAVITGKGQLWLTQRIKHYKAIEQKAIQGITQGVINMSK